LLTFLFAIGWIATGITLIFAFQSLRDFQRKHSELQDRIDTLLNEAEILKSHAYRDHLTGLANRALLEDRCQLAMERAKRSQNSFAMLMVDLDRFKEINDTYGHAAGDVVLTNVGLRLAGSVRTVDTVARLGGDEFVLLIESINERSELTRIGQKLIDRLSERVALEPGKEVSVGASIGFSIFPDDGNTTSELLAVADQSMYQCKTSGLMPLF
jgi:diguanylate cyclase (GGDEF)-like protein